MNQRARAEKAESDNAALRRRNKELSVRVETHTDSVDLSRDQTLELLIDARMKNANDQEEIARMRNELLKVKTADKDGMGSFRKETIKEVDLAYQGVARIPVFIVPLVELVVVTHAPDRTSCTAILFF
eukprot:IDg5217t1